MLGKSLLPTVVVCIATPSIKEFIEVMVLYLVLWFWPFIGGFVFLSAVVGFALIYAALDNDRGHDTIRSPRLFKAGLIVVLGPIAGVLALGAYCIWIVLKNIP